MHVYEKKDKLGRTIFSRNNLGNWEHYIELLIIFFFLPPRQSFLRKPLSFLACFLNFDKTGGWTLTEKKDLSSFSPKQKITFCHLYVIRSTYSSSWAASPGKQEKSLPPNASIHFLLAAYISNSTVSAWWRANFYWSGPKY